MPGQNSFYDRAEYQEVGHSSTIGSLHRREFFHGSGHTLPEHQPSPMQILMDRTSNPQFWGENTSQELLIPKEDLARSTSGGDSDQYYDPKQSLEKAYRENLGLREALAHATDTKQKLDRKDVDRILEVTKAAYKWLDNRKKHLGVVIPEELDRLRSPWLEPTALIDFRKLSEEVDRLPFLENCRTILEFRYKEHPFLPKEIDERIQEKEIIQRLKEEEAEAANRSLAGDTTFGSSGSTRKEIFTRRPFEKKDKEQRFKEKHTRYLKYASELQEDDYYTPQKIRQTSDRIWEMQEWIEGNKKRLGSPTLDDDYLAKRHNLIKPKMYIINDILNASLPRKEKNTQS